MTTYYDTTLLDEMEHDRERRKGVCCRDKLTNHGRYRRGAIRRYAPGYHRGGLRAIRCTSRRDSSSQSLSSHCTLQCGCGSRTPGPRRSYCSVPLRRRCLLETIEARLHGRGIVSVFARSLLYLRRVRVVQIPECIEIIEL